MSRKKPQTSWMSELFATSEDRVKHTRETFEAARTTLTNARTFGTEAHALDASHALARAAEFYADAMRSHARIVVDYTTERTSNP